MEDLYPIIIRNLIDESINRMQERQSHLNVESNEETDFHSSLNGLLMPDEDNNSHLLSGAEAVSMYERFKELKSKQFQEQVIMTPSNSTSSTVCRICRFERVSRDLIESPCKCKGSLGYVHDKCLIQWKNIRKSNICEICHHKYEFNCASIPYRRLFKNFFKKNYFGRVINNVLQLFVTTWLFGTNGCQMNDFIKILEESEKIPVILNLMCPVFILGSGLILYAYAETADYILYEIIEELSDWWWSAQQEDIWGE